MNVNKKNIQKVINLISKDDGTHFRMNNWVVYVNSEADKMTQSDASSIGEFIECGTAFCVAGYANLIRLEEEGHNPKLVKGSAFFGQFSSEWRAQEWLGIEKTRDAEDLFMSGGHSTNMVDDLPANIRRQAAINVLSHLRDTGEIDWRRAIDAAKRA